MTGLDQRHDLEEVSLLKKSKKISFGEGTYIDLEKTELRHVPKNGKVTIGKYCQIAGGTTFILGGNHRHDWTTTYPFNKFLKRFPAAAKLDDQFVVSKGDITIQNDVWIGLDVTILSGVTIGNGAVVAAKSVVTKDVPPYTIVAGNPAVLKRYRFQYGSEISTMLDLAWWDWPKEKINALVEYLCQPSPYLLELMSKKYDEQHS